MENALSPYAIKKRRSKQSVEKEEEMIRYYIIDRREQVNTQQTIMYASSSSVANFLYGKNINDFIIIKTFSNPNSQKIVELTNVKNLENIINVLDDTK